MTLTGTITHIVARKARVIDFTLDDRALRLSGFAPQGIAVPPIGTRVEVRLDKAGYVREIVAVPE